jgi:hypothetical protein
MPMLEDVKKIAEKVSGWSRPKPSALSGLIRERKASTFRFKDDGIVPNIRNGRLSSIAAQSDFRTTSIRRPCSKSFLKVMGGAIHGEMAFTNTCTTIPASMKRLALPAAKARCSSADTAVAFRG